MNKEKKPGRIKNAVRRWLGVPISLTDGEFWAAYAGGQSAAGKSVTVDKALQLSAVWSCVRLLGGVNEASGATNTLTGLLDSVANNIDQVATAAGALVAVGAARYLGNMALGASSATAGIINAAKSEVALAEAQVRGTQVSTARARAAVYRAQQALAAARGTDAQASAEKRLSLAQESLNRNIQARVSAQTALNSVTAVGSRLMGGALGLVGGIPGLVLLGAGIRFIRKHFNVVLERTVRELRGEPCLGLEEFAPVKQEIVCSRSFGGRITEYHEMRQAICSYASRAAEKLRGEHQYCRFISAFVKTSPFALNEPYYGNSASVKLLTPTQDSRDIITAATKCLDVIWRDGHRYQKAGVMLGDFYSQGVAQLNLFDDNAPRKNSEVLMEVLDHLNAKNGRGALYFAGQGIQAAWQMKREMLSPRYTTRYSDLLKVR